MTPKKKTKGVLLITCRWCVPDLPEGSSIPGGGHVISVQCTGGIRPDLLYNAFLQGAQGILIVGCPDGGCHFAHGNSIAKNTVRIVQAVLQRANLDPRRLRLELPEKASLGRIWKLLDEMRIRVGKLKKLGIKPLPPEKPWNRELKDIVCEHGGTACMDCGKCTALCPVTLQDSTYSPRSMVHHALHDSRATVLSGTRLWQCRTCGRCAERCPQGVFLPRIIRALREEACAEGYQPAVIHADVFRFLATIGTWDGFKNKWDDWPDRDLELDPESKIAFYPGCLSFYEPVFGRELGLTPMDSASSAIRILNLMGIRPRLLPELGCCGHDLFWTGQTRAFTEVAKTNIRKIEESGITTVITTCPECAAIFERYYPKVYREGDFEVQHLLEYMGANISRLRFHKRRHRVHPVTYHDPCRLVRHFDVVDEPRELLNMIPQVKLKEMQYSGRQAYCCGTAGWTGCDAASKKIQLRRLRAAREAGAEVMLTACPKCHIHFNCARADIPSGTEAVEVQDIFTFLASSMLPSNRKNVLLQPKSSGRKNGVKGE